MTAHITIRGARLHNLKNVTLTIPKDQLVVLTGLSGSGKSTLGFDILHKESQRQYIEALGMAAFGLAKPPVDSITGLSPSVSVDQHLTNHSPRSTVGTTTDVYAYLRVLFARLGHRPCPICGKDVPPAFDPSNAEAEWESESSADDDAATSEETFPCPHCGTPIPVISMGHFSFNKPEGACPTCTGLGTIQQVNIGRFVDERKSILEGAVAGWDTVRITYHTAILRAAAAHYGFAFDLALSVKDYTPQQRDLLFFGVESPRFRHHFPDIEPPATVRAGRFEGIATSLLRRYAEHLHEHVREADYRDKLEAFLVTQTCPGCAGTRLRPASRVVTLSGQTIIALSRLPLSELGAWLEGLPITLSPDERRIAAPILVALREGIARLVEAGAGYLALERAAPTLSAGEAQRLRLASLLGSGLSGVLYVFDEPTIGLHHRDTHRLIAVLRRLRDLGNTVLVIEHDLDMIAAADYVVDFGPGAGKHGGQVVAAGTPTDIAEQPASLTGAYLAGRACIPVPPRRRAPNGSAITIHGARHHNLQNITVSLPLGVLVAVTGVSGSGNPRWSSTSSTAPSARACMARATLPANMTPSKASRLSRRSSRLTRNTSGACRARTPPPIPRRSRRSAKPLPPLPTRAAVGSRPGTSRSTSQVGAARAAKAPASSPSPCSCCRTWRCAARPATGAASPARRSPCATAITTSPRCSI